MEKISKKSQIPILRAGKKKLPPPPKKPPPPPPSKRTKIDGLKQQRSKENKKTISSIELYKREKSKVLWEQIKILSTSKRPNYKKLLALINLSEQSKVFQLKASIFNKRMYGEKQQKSPIY